MTDTTKESFDTRRPLTPEDSVEGVQLLLERWALLYDPFANDFGESGTKTLKDKIVTLRKSRTCSHCGRDAQEESRCRSRTERYQGKLEEYIWCADCTRAMGMAFLDEGSIFEALGRL